MAVVKRLLASSPSDLDALGWWLHDAKLHASHVVHDAEQRIVTLAFAQERLDPDHRLPGAARVRRTWCFDEYALPLLRCRLTVRRATALRWPDDEEDVFWLTGLDYRRSKGVVRVWTNWRSIDIPAAPLDVELAITDEIDRIKRRRVGRGLRWDTTGDWPPQRQDAVAALVARTSIPPRRASSQ